MKFYRKLLPSLLVFITMAYSSLFAMAQYEMNVLPKGEGIPPTLLERWNKVKNMGLIEVFFAELFSRDTPERVATEIKRIQEQYQAEKDFLKNSYRQKREVDPYMDFIEKSRKIGQEEQEISRRDFNKVVDVVTIVAPITGKGIRASKGLLSRIVTEKSIAPRGLSTKLFPRTSKYKPRNIRLVTRRTPERLAKRVDLTKDVYKMTPKEFNDSYVYKMIPKLEDRATKQGFRAFYDDTENIAYIKPDIKNPASTIRHELMHAVLTDKRPIADLNPLTGYAKSLISRSRTATPNQKAFAKFMGELIPHMAEGRTTGEQIAKAIDFVYRKYPKIYAEIHFNDLAVRYGEEVAEKAISKIITNTQSGKYLVYGLITDIIGAAAIHYEVRTIINLDKEFEADKNY